MRILGVESLGGLEAVEAMIKGAGKRDGVFGHGSVGSNLVRRYKDLMKVPGLAEKSGIAAEFERKAHLAAHLTEIMLVQQNILSGRVPA